MVQWDIEPEATEATQISWRVTLFGTLRAQSHGHVIDKFPTQKTASLLAFLAFYRHRRLTREELATTLWPDADSASARDRLSQSLVWLRPHLEPDGAPRGSVLVADRLSVGLDPATVTTDVAEFEDALTTARHAATPDTQRHALLRAIDLYQGDLLPGEYADWVLVERRRLLEAHLSAIHSMVRLYERENDREQALEMARRAVTADPLQEEAHQELLRLLAATGRTAAALLHFRDLRRLLADAVGAEPSPTTQALIERIRQDQQQPSSSPVSAPPAPVVVPSPHRPIPLPASLTRFFGREAEREQIIRMIREEGARLVTLIGTGGSGKTRLSLATAAALSEAYDGAVVFVPLADLDDTRMIPTAIATALRLTGSGPRPVLEMIVEELSTRPFLLILDNVEHLVAGVPPLVRDLLERIPTLTLLATSRQRLGVEGEREMPVGSLPVPESDAPLEQFLLAPSIQLFADRARAVRPGFALTAANVSAVAGICTRLDGIPLAIELCAAWAQTLTPFQMLEKLERRFDLLVSRRTDLPPRHRTLRAALEYSYLQLSEPLQRLFVRLSVFRGGWTLEAVAAVCYEVAPDTLELLADLTELRERSLIFAEEIASSGTAEPEMRYRLLETLREYAGELVSYADRAALRRAHALYFLALAERAEDALSGPDQERTLLALDREIDNLRTALGWSMEAQEPVIGLRLAGALGRYWAAHGPLQEGEQWLRRLLGAEAATGAPESVSPEVQAKAWGALGRLIWFQGAYKEARAAHERALSIRREIGDTAGIAESLYHLGITAYRQDDHTPARAFLEESLSLAQERNDPAGVARVLLNLGNIALDEGNRDEARTLFRQSMALEEQLGNRQRVANALNNLGLLSLGLGDRAEASELFEESLAISREITDYHGIASALAGLGTCARLQNEPERARDLLVEGLRLAHDMGDRFIMVHHLLQLGILEATEETAPARGIFLVSAAQHLFERVVGSLRITEADGYRAAQDTARAALGDTLFESLWAAGGVATLDQVVSVALDPAGPDWNEKEIRRLRHFGVNSD